jgi:pimeloyl-ACP methyl ester carboxylesterase
VLLPPWSIVHSRVYKAQIPYFSERFRCIAYDGRGNGKSDRPSDRAYSLDNCCRRRARRHGRDRRRQAILVGLSFGGLIACVLAAYHPERVKAAILAGTAARIGPGPVHVAEALPAQRSSFEGWNKYNREHWLATIPTSPSIS